jgi:hypothetical protein
VFSVRIITNFDLQTTAGWFMGRILISLCNKRADLLTFLMKKPKLINDGLFRPRVALFA